MHSVEGGKLRHESRAHFTAATVLLSILGHIGNDERHENRYTCVSNMSVR